MRHIHCPGYYRKFEAVTSTLVIDIKRENNTEPKSTEEIKKYQTIYLKIISYFYSELQQEI